MNGSVKLKVYCNGWMHVTNKVLGSENWKERKRQAVVFSGVRTLTCRKTEEFTSETSDRCLQELNLLCC